MSSALVMRPPIATPAIASAPRGLWADAWRQLRRNRGAVAGLLVVVAFAGLGLLAPLLAPYAYDDQDWSAFLVGPTPDHLLGTDELGRDVLSRLLFGARVSMTVGFVAQAIIIAIGVPLGLVAGYFRGWVDATIMRLVEILYAFPSLLLVILVASYLKGLAGAKP